MFVLTYSVWTLTRGLGYLGVPCILLGICVCLPFPVVSTACFADAWRSNVVPCDHVPSSLLFLLWVGVQAQTAGRAEASGETSEAAKARARLPGLPPAPAAGAEAPGEEATVPLQGGHESQ